MLVFFLWVTGFVMLTSWLAMVILRKLIGVLVFMAAVGTSWVLIWLIAYNVEGIAYVAKFH